MSEDAIYIKAESPEQYEIQTLLQTLLAERRHSTWRDRYHVYSVTSDGAEGLNLELVKEICKKLELEIKLVHVLESFRKEGVSIIATAPNHITLLDISDRYLSVKTWAPSIDLAGELTQKIVELLPLEEAAADSVPFSFWRLAANGQPYATDKNLVCPTFEEIKENYSPEVAQQFEKLVNLGNPDEYGKIVIWHGAPGNGKTFLIRALSREWNLRHEVEPEILLDPESFFQQSHYLDSLLTSERASEGLRLVIIEDYAHIITNNCRQHPGFARLLNATDGLLGQGQRIIFLLTTNEKIETVDPAILRPGRCLQKMEVKSMSQKAGIDWLKKKGIENPRLDGKEEVSLAELYAVLHGNPFENAEDKGKFGF